MSMWKTLEEQKRPLRMLRDWMMNEFLTEKDNIHPEKLSAMAVTSNMVSKALVRKFGEQETIVHLICKMLDILCFGGFLIWY